MTPADVTDLCSEAAAVWGKRASKSRPPEAVHRAFLAIDEYRRRISPDIAGAAP